MDNDPAREMNRRIGTGVFVLGAPDANRQTNHAAFSWVAYAGTGDGGLIATSIFDPMMMPNPNPSVAIFYESFLLPFGANAGSLTVWEDDSTRVRLDITLREDDDSNQDTHCAAGPIGCQPPQKAPWGLYDLYLSGWRQWERGGDGRADGPFDLLLSRQKIPVGEMGNFALLGTCLAVLAVVSAMSAGNPRRPGGR